MPKYAKQVSARQMIIPCMYEIIFALQKLIIIKPCNNVHYP